MTIQTSPTVVRSLRRRLDRIWQAIESTKRDHTANVRLEGGAVGADSEPRMRRNLRTVRVPQRGNPSVVHLIARTRPITACEALFVNEVFSKRIIELEPSAQSLLNAPMATPPYLAFHSPEHLDRLTAGSRFVVPGGADCCGRCLAYRLRL